MLLAEGGGQRTVESHCPLPSVKEARRKALARGRGCEVDKIVTEKRS